MWRRQRRFVEGFKFSLSLTAVKKPTSPFPWNGIRKKHPHGNRWNRDTLLSDTLVQKSNGKEWTSKQQLFDFTIRKPTSKIQSINKQASIKPFFTGYKMKLNMKIILLKVSKEVGKVRNVNITIKKKRQNYWTDWFYYAT